LAWREISAIAAAEDSDGVGPIYDVALRRMAEKWLRRSADDQ